MLKIAEAVRRESTQEELCSAPLFVYKPTTALTNKFYWKKSALIKKNRNVYFVTESVINQVNGRK